MSAGHRAISVSCAVIRVASRSPFCKGWRALLVCLAWLQTKLIGVEIWSVARQVVHSQLAVQFRCVFLDRESLVGRKSLDDQKQEFPISAQHPAQQIHEQRAGQGVHRGATQ